MSEPLAPELVEQDLPNGGSFEGDLPSAAVPVVPVGIVTTRDVPALDATAGRLDLAPGESLRIGRDPARRRLWLSVRPDGAADGDTVVTVSTVEQQARSGYGFALQRGSMIAVTCSCELWFALDIGADRPAVVTFLAERDPS